MFILMNVLQKQNIKHVIFYCQYAKLEKVLLIVDKFIPNFVDKQNPVDVTTEVNFVPDNLPNQHAKFVRIQKYKILEILEKGQKKSEFTERY